MNGGPERVWLGARETVARQNGVEAVGRVWVIGGESKGRQSARESCYGVPQYGVASCEIAPRRVKNQQRSREQPSVTRYGSCPPRSPLSSAISVARNPRAVSVDRSRVFFSSDSARFKDARGSAKTIRRSVLIS